MSLSPLPADLGVLDRQQARAAYDEREARAKELARMPVETMTAGDLDELRALNDDLERLRQPMPHPGHPTPRGTRSRPDADGFGRLRGIGDAFIRGTTGGKMFAALDGTSGGTMVPAFFDPQIRDLPQRQLFVRSLIPTVGCTGDKVWYLRQTVATQNAAAVAAGGLKPTSVYTIARIEETVRTVAHVTEALDRALLSDFDALSEFIDTQLRLGVLLEEEDQILNGNGAGANMTGILNTAGIQTQALGADPVPDAILKAMTKIRLQFMEPDGIVLHPNDFRDVRLLRTADGEYIFGDPADAGATGIFGLQVVQSALMTEGTGLVGAFGVASQVYDRDEARVTFAETGLGNNAGEEMFTRNQVRFRGESRLALAVIRPAGFCTVTSI